MTMNDLNLQSSFYGTDISVLTAKAQARLKQTEQELENGEYERFENLDDLNQIVRFLVKNREF